MVRGRVNEIDVISGIKCNEVMRLMSSMCFDDFSCKGIRQKQFSVYGNISTELLYLYPFVETSHIYQYCMMMLCFADFNTKELSPVQMCRKRLEFCVFSCGLLGSPAEDYNGNLPRKLRGYDEKYKCVEKY